MRRIDFCCKQMLILGIYLTQDNKIRKIYKGTDKKGYYGDFKIMEHI